MEGVVATSAESAGSASKHGPSGESANGSRITPIVIDLGKEKRKRLRALKRGKGPLVDDVASVVDEIKSRMGGNKEFVPIVFIYRQKRRRKNRGLFPFLD